MDQIVIFIMNIVSCIQLNHIFFAVLVCFSSLQLILILQAATSLFWFTLAAAVIGVVSKLLFVKEAPAACEHSGTFC